MMGPKPKAPKETRAAVEEQIRAILGHMPAQSVLGTLFPYFTTIDLIGIRDQLTPDKEPSDGL